MPIEVLMPALSPTMEKGTLAKWHVKEGDHVAAGDVIAEIETDKATMEVEAVDEGTVGKIVVAEGTEDVPVNQPIAFLLEQGEDADAIEAATAPEKPEKKEEAKPGAPAPEKPKETAPPRTQARAQDAAPAAPTGGNGAATSGRIFASPLARRLAREKGIDLTALRGSGPRGRIVRRDVEEGPAAPAAARAPGAAPAPTMGDDQVKALFEPGSFEELPHDGMRRVIARRLVESKTTIPHFYLTVEIELDALLALRKELNAAAPKDADGAPAYRLSVNDFLIRALALALKKVPMANATWTEGARLLHKTSDVGVAVAVEDGLFTPVIRRADEKTISAISAEMRDLAARARARKLKPEDYQGGTTSLSNLGMYGISDFSAVINPPHATILAVGAGGERAVVKSGRIVVATMMSATLSCDHRVVDGALGAELLAAFRGLVEKPMGMLV